MEKYTFWSAAKLNITSEVILQRYILKTVLFFIFTVTKLGLLLFVRLVSCRGAAGNKQGRAEWSWVLSISTHLIHIRKNSFVKGQRLESNVSSDVLCLSTIWWHSAACSGEMQRRVHVFCAYRVSLLCSCIIFYAMLSKKEERLLLIAGMRNLWEYSTLVVLICVKFPVKDVFVLAWRCYEILAFKMLIFRLLFYIIRTPRPRFLHRLNRVSIFTCTL
jgi:hypothetical protein